MVDARANRCLRRYGKLSVSRSAIRPANIDVWNAPTMKAGTVLLREQQRLLGCHRVTARLRVVAHIARGRLRVAPFADVALVRLGARGELGRRERAMGRELAVQTEPVADDDERRHRAAAEVDDRAAEQVVELVLVDGRSLHRRDPPVVAAAGHCPCTTRARGLPRGPRSCPSGQRGARGFTARPRDLTTSTAKAVRFADGCPFRAAACREDLRRDVLQRRGLEAVAHRRAAVAAARPVRRGEREPRHRVPLRDARHAATSASARRRRRSRPGICSWCRTATRTRWATGRVRAAGQREELPSLLQGKLACSYFGGGGEKTNFVCGYLACEAGLIRPVLAGLPRIVRVNIRSDAAGEWLESSILHAVERMSASRSRAATSFSRGSPRCCLPRRCSGI